MKIAMLQMVSGSDRDRNLDQARHLLAQAAQAGAELAVLPEYFCLMGRQDGDKLLIQETPGHGPIQAFLSEQARAHRMWVVGGTLPLSTDDPARVTNSCLVHDPQGRCVARYDKIHLFRFQQGAERYDESKVLRAGAAPVCVDVTDRSGRSWRVGLSVCYDLRFPELYRHCAALGAQLLLVPSAFTQTTGRAHWEVLLRARAIENLCFVGAAAQGGTHDNGRSTWGQSLVIDPWGRLLAQEATGPAVVLADLDPAELAARRTQLPALEHRVL